MSKRIIMACLKKRERTKFKKPFKTHGLHTKDIMVYSHINRFITVKRVTFFFRSSSLSSND